MKQLQDSLNAWFTPSPSAHDEPAQAAPATQPEARSIGAVAREIRQRWAKPYFGAVPYLQAMSYLQDKRSTHGADDAESIVLYFLSNATTFRGEDARRLKAELKSLIA